MFFKLTVEFGRSREEPEVEEYRDVSSGQHERAPIGFSVEDPWEEWEDKHVSRGKR